MEEILQILPHRYPFLLVDRILELEPGRRAVGIKCVSANEPFFQGHFPGRPIMPGVLILEAMAQVGAVAVLSVPENRGKLALFAGADRVRWRRPVVPGDRLQLEVEIIAVRGPVGKGSARATVEGELAAEAELSFALRPA
ncbi:MAG: 3-hydroxyacyl-ACP dehydratase FabZ [Symbiobacteriaceae bacterium]